MINEELHPDIKNVINNENIPAHHKHKAMASLFRSLLKNGVDTGLQDGKPKKGSSRAVYFPKDADDITIDGTPSKMKSVLKIAYPGTLDKYNDSGMLFGEHQNIAEASRFVQHTHGMIRQEDDGSYSTNEHGVLAPVIHAHPEGHYLHMGQIDPVKEGDFRKHTQTPEFPKGISHKEFYDAVNQHYAESHGRNHNGSTSDERLEQVHEHPLVQNTIDFVNLTGAHPVDFDKRNMGVWTHPVTGKKHVVLSDYGYNTGLATEYTRARRKQAQVIALRRRMW